MYSSTFYISEGYQPDGKNPIDINNPPKNGSFKLFYINDFDVDFDKDSLAERAKAKIEEESPELSEERIIKAEIKTKVQNYFDERTDKAVSQIRNLIYNEFSDDEIYTAIRNLKDIILR